MTLICLHLNFGFNSQSALVSQNTLDCENVLSFTVAANSLIKPASVQSANICPSLWETIARGSVTHFAN